MAKYDITHSCGHVWRHEFIGPRRSREYQIEKQERRVCDDCWRAERERQRAEENAASAEENKANELPSLIGTEAQIAWAETIRAKAIRRVEELLETSTVSPDDEHALASLLAETTASWWIDNRLMGPSLLLRQRKRMPVPSPVTSEDELVARAAVIVQPEQAVTATVAEIRALDSAVEVVFPEKLEKVRELMHTLRYKWTGALWQRKIGQFTGPAADRAAEVGHRLLAAGIPIRMFDDAVRARAIAGEYAPEPTRWVKRSTEGKYKDWFVITWRQPDDLYTAAKRLPGNRYHEGAVYVPAEQFEQVLDFAERYQFSVSPGGAQLSEEARRMKEATLVAQVAPVQAPAPTKASRLPPQLVVPAEVTVDDELRDDD